MESKFNLNDLVQSTMKVLIKNYLKDLNNSKPLRNLKDRKNIFNQICIDIFGNNFEYKDCLRLHKWWLKNTNNFRNLIYEHTAKMNCSKKSIVLDLDVQDLKLLKNLIGDYKIMKTKSCIRRKFKKEFDNFISLKLQNLGLKCWLKCKSNWFKKNNSRKISAAFWKGTFVCIDNECKNLFKATIMQEISWGNNF